MREAGAAVTALVLLVGGLLGPSTARGQDAAIAIIVPGDGQLDGHRIPAYTHSWQSYRLSPGGERRPTAVWYDTVSVVEEEGRQFLRRVQAIVQEGQPTTVLINEAHRASFLPRRTLARLGEAEPFIDLHFTEREVTGRRLLLPHNGQPADVVPVELTLRLPAPAYDWRWWGLLVAALPLQRNYAARFLASAAEPSLGVPLILITARVTGEEQVGRVRCWVVEVEAGVPWTLWITQERGAAPVQRISITQPDGGALVWEPLGSGTVLDTPGPSPAADTGHPQAYDPAPRQSPALQNVAGLSLTVLVEAAQLGGTELELAELTFPPGSGADGRAHRHGRVEILYLLSGRLDHTVNGESHPLGPGGVGIVRPGDLVVHRVLSDEPVRALVIWAPAGELERLAPLFHERPGGEDPDAR